MGAALALHDEDTFILASDLLTEEFPYDFEQCCFERHADVHAVLEMALHGALLDSQRSNLIQAIICFGQDRNYLIRVPHFVLKYYFNAELKNY